MSKKKQIEEMFNLVVDGVIDGEDNHGVPTGKTCFDIAESLYNAGYRKQIGWISVEERLPDIDPCGKGRYGGARSVRVLCACKQRDGRTFVKEGYYEPCGNGNVFWRIPGSIDSVTHWMPLPEPPVMKGGAE